MEERSGENYGSHRYAKKPPVLAARPRTTAELAILVPWGSCCYNLTFIFKDVSLILLTLHLQKPGSTAVSEHKLRIMIQMSSTVKAPPPAGLPPSSRTTRPLHHTSTISTEAASAHLNLYRMETDLQF